MNLDQIARVQADVGRVQRVHLDERIFSARLVRLGRDRAQWEEAKGNDAAFKTLKNTILGEIWQEQGEAPDRGGGSDAQCPRPLAGEEQRLCAQCAGKLG